MLTRHLYFTSYNNGTKTYFSISGGISVCNDWEKENIRIISLSFTHVGVESWELPWNVTTGKAITQSTSFENPVVWI